MPNTTPIGLGPKHNEYTVIAVYREPVQIYCETVLAESPEAASVIAWDECRASNNWDDATREEEWVDELVIEGPVRVVL